jgi:NADH-quinone oxidoreductase subunit L
LGLETYILTYAPPAILLLPLAVAALLLAAGRRMDKGADYAAIGGLLASFLLSVLLFAVNVNHGGADGRGWAGAQAKPFVVSFEWISAGGASLPLGFLVDNLSSFMSIIVTGLGTLVLVYSIFYMHGDSMYRRYYWQMSFFCFSMLGIVFSANLFMTFVFWELVGLGSYLLIGFWYYKPPAAEDHHYQELKAKHATGIDERYLSPAYAQKKAFVMNRVGDFGFLSGIMIFAAVMLAAGGPSGGGPLDFTRMYAAREAGAFQNVTLWGLSGEALLTIAGILTFMGAIGKSAQFPLHTWLPDAMQGPTTGSSIIHAATMVAAGVYMTARMHPLLTDGALLFVAFIGGITAFLAATMAMVQWDLKAVLAYSTISQLGYMMLGLGSATYTAGVAHLFTHAIFKCMLFLCAGSVIHACHHSQDLFRMGGLRKKLPLTYLATLAGVLAITGVPGFSGFYSKDAILAGALARALEHGGVHWIPFLLGMVTAALTAYYMFRLLFMTFHGEPRDHHLFEHAHESPPVATVPLLILAAGCLGFWWSGHLIGGDLGALPGLTVHVSDPWSATLQGEEQGWINALIVSPAGLPEMWEPPDNIAQIYWHHVAHWTATGLSLLALAVGFFAARALYLKRLADPDRLLEKHAPLAWGYRLTSQLWYFDRFYQNGIVPAVKWANRWLFRFDFHVLDQIAVDGWAYLARGVSAACRGWDDWVVDKCVDAFGWAAWFAGAGVRRVQAGRIQYYAGVTFGVTVLVMLWLLLW